MLWEWIAWDIDDSAYDFSTNNDGSNSMRAQIAYMHSKVQAHALLLEFSCCAAMYQAWPLSNFYQIQIWPAGCMQITKGMDNCSMMLQIMHCTSIMAGDILVYGCADGKCPGAPCTHPCQQLHQYTSLI